MPSGVSGADLQDQDHGQTVVVSASIVKKKKRKKKRRKQKLQLALGAGAIFVAGLGLRYATRTPQSQGADSKDDNDEGEPDEDSGSDKKHTLENQEKVKKILGDGVTRGGDGVSAQQLAGIQPLEVKSAEELFQRLSPLALIGDYISLNDMLKQNQAYVSSLTDDQKKILIENALIRRKYLCKSPLQTIPVFNRMVEEDAHEFRQRILGSKACTMQLLLNAKIYSSLKADDTQDQKNACMARYLYKTYGDVESKTRIRVDRQNPMDSKFPVMVAAEMLGYSLPDIEQYAVCYKRDKEVELYPACFLIDLPSHAERPLCDVYTNKNTTLDDFKKEIRIRSLLQDNIFLPGKITIKDEDGNHVKDSSILVSYITVGSSARKRLQIILDDE